MKRACSLLIVLLMLSGAVLTTGCAPKFELSPLEASPPVCVPGETVTISTTLTNSGSAGGDYTAEFLVNDVVTQTETFTLEPEESQVVSLALKKDEPGKYVIQLGELSTQFIMLQPRNLDVSPPEVEVGQPVKVTAVIDNVADTEATYHTSLFCQGNEVEARDITMVANSTQDVVFTLSQQAPGNYEVELLGLQGSFRVLKPAEFEVSELAAIPSALEAGKEAAVSAEVTNVGEVDGVYSGHLNVDGEVLDSKEVSVGAGSSERISFTLSLDTPGTYSVALGDATAMVEVWPHAAEIVKLAQESWKDVKSYQAEATLTMNISAKSEEEVTEANISMNYDLTVDYEAEKMKAVITMTLESTEEGKEEGTIEMYLVGNTAYAKVEAPGEPTGWQKETVDPDTRENMQLPEQQLDILETASVELLGTEEVDGIDCYSLEISLSGEQMWQALLQSMAAGAGEEIGPEDIEAMQEVGQLLETAEVSVRQWVTRDAYFLKSAKMTMDWSLLGLVSIEMGLDMTVSNYNEPVTIELPAEALLAPAPPPPPTPSRKLIYEDDFSNPNSGWVSTYREGSESGYENGEYYIFVKKYNWAACRWNRNMGQIADFALEIDARLTSGPKESLYGVIFRVQSTKAENYYRFLVSGDGYYLIGTKTNDVWTRLQGWTRSPFIKEGYSINHLKVVCKGSQIEVYVNGQHLTTITDDSFAEGCVGMIVDTPEPNARVAFDNLKVYSLD